MKGEKWFLAAAEAGHKKAQYQVGHYLKYDDGLEQDLKKAFEWFKKAADQGCLKSRLEIADSYFFGHGVKKSYKEAARWYSRVAKLQGSGDRFFVTRFKEKLFETIYPQIVAILVFILYWVLTFYTNLPDKISYNKFSILLEISVIFSVVSIGHLMTNRSLLDSLEGQNRRTIKRLQDSGNYDGMTYIYNKSIFLCFFTILISILLLFSDLDFISFTESIFISLWISILTFSILLYFRIITLFRKLVEHYSSEEF